jgi:hypothetical protein
LSAKEIYCKGGSLNEGEMIFEFSQDIPKIGRFILSKTIKNEDSDTNDFQIFGSLREGKINNLILFFLKYNVRSSVFTQGIEVATLTGSVEEIGYYLNCRIRDRSEV